MSTKSRSMSAAVCQALALVLLFGLAPGASAALLVNLDFEDGVALGSPVTSTANRGTAGGTAAGGDLDGAGAGGVTYAAGPGGASLDRGALFVDANTGTGGSALGGRVVFSLPAGQVAATSDWSVMAAVRMDSGNLTFDRIVDPFFDLADDNYGLRFAVGSGNVLSYPVPQTVPVNDGQWHHLAVTGDYDGSTNTSRQYTRIYVDSVLVTTAPFATRFDFSGGITFVLGSQAAGTRPFDGALDDVRFYNELLDAGAVYQAYFDSFMLPEPTAGLGLAAAGAWLWARRRPAR